MRVLVSGASGFIGGAIARAARSRGWSVGCVAGRSGPGAGLDDLPWKSFEDWADSGERFDAFIHAAALRHRHGVKREDYARENNALTGRALRTSERCCSRFVLVSSIAVYGWPQRLPVDESFPNAPVAEYGQSKVVCEQAVRGGGQPFTIVQPSITYGPGDTNGMMDKILRMVARRFFVVPGLGRTRVQLVYIDDLARLTLDAAASEATKGERFICTYRDPIRVCDLIKLSSRTVGRWIPPVGPPTRLLSAGARALEVAEGLGLISREPPLTREKLATISVDRAYRIDHMRRLLGDEPAIGYHEGIERTARALGLR